MDKNYGFMAHKLIYDLSKMVDKNPKITGLCRYFSNQCEKAIKFDLGDLKSIDSMCELSTKEFFPIPYPVCLFQVIDEEETGVFHFLLSEERNDVFLKRETDDKSITTAVIWTWFSIRGKVLEVSKYQLVVGKSGINENNESKILFNLYDYINGELADLSDTALHEEYRDNYGYVFKVIASIEVFSCSNVITIENYPPKFINDKRKEKGKIPFFSYRTLHITGEYSDVVHDTQYVAKGTHASPRLHLRRGHIRKLSDGRRVWISACLVGDKSKGIVGKDYLVGLTYAGAY